MKDSGSHCRDSEDLLKDLIILIFGHLQFMVCLLFFLISQGFAKANECSVMEK